MDASRSRKTSGPASVHRTSFRVWLFFFVAAKIIAVVLFLREHYAAAALVFFAPAPWLIFQIVVPSARGLASAITRFNTRTREIWLTIDDGPSPETTPAMLDLLEQHRARATFFLIGDKARQHPALTAEIVRRGHTVGNHTATHPCWGFWCASARRTAAEIDRGGEALGHCGVGPSPWFRPPAGVKNVFLQPLLAARGLELVLWSARGLDGANLKPNQALARIAAHLTPGAIVLVHENQHHPDASLQLLRGLLAHLSREGYACVIPPTAALVRS